MGPSVYIAVPNNLQISRDLFRKPLSALGVEWRDPEDSFWFGEEDPSPFGVGFQPQFFLEGEEAILKQQLVSLASHDLVVGSACNKDIDHRRLATVACCVAASMNTVLRAQLLDQIPSSAALRGWSRLLTPSEPCTFVYAMEPRVLQALADEPRFRLVK